MKHAVRTKSIQLKRAATAKSTQLQRAVTAKRNELQRAVTTRGTQLQRAMTAKGTELHVGMQRALSFKRSKSMLAIKGPDEPTPKPAPAAPVFETWEERIDAEQRQAMFEEQSALQAEILQLQMKIAAAESRPSTALVDWSRPSTATTYAHSRPPTAAADTWTRPVTASTEWSRPSSRPATGNSESGAQSRITAPPRMGASMERMPSVRSSPDASRAPTPWLRSRIEVVDEDDAEQQRESLSAEIDEIEDRLRQLTAGSG